MNTPRNPARPAPDPASGGQRVQAPDAVNGEEPAIGGSAGTQDLERGMKKAADRDAASPDADSQDTQKRRAARGTPRENDAGA
ncbi:hypothetical protein [Variovorax sp. W2I14]|uniref:hypothetical protein n=1 Tax=Variovorax sp. W2I14 TaxID=3042290 RepID=UPI003D25B469